MFVVYGLRDIPLTRLSTVKDITKVVAGPYGQPMGKATPRQKKKRKRKRKKCSQNI
jgi:hypothetical protein